MILVISGCASEKIDTDAPRRQAEELLKKVRDERGAGHLESAVKTLRDSPLRLQFEELEHEYADSLNNWRYGPEVTSELEKSVARFPDSERLKVHLAIAHNAAGHPKEAIKVLEGITPKSGTASLFYITRALSFSAAGEREEAFRNIERAIDLNPGGEVGYRVRSTIHFQGGDYEAALKDINKAISCSDGDNYHAYFNRGSLHRVMGNYEKAYLDFKHARQLHDSEAVRKELFDAAMRTGRRSEAEKLVPRDHPILIADRLADEADKAKRQGDAKTALEKMNDAIKIDPDNPNLKMLRAGIYEDLLGDWKSALKDMNAACSSKLKTPYFFATRAKLLGSHKKYREAERDMTYAIEHVKAVPSIWYFLRANYREKLGDSRGAGKDRQSAGRVSP